MPVREPLPARAALSRLPRWVTALGIAALAGELVGAALLVTGPHRLAVNHGRTQTATGNHGRTQTVVLRVDGVPLANDKCRPVPPVPCGPEVGYGTYGTALEALTPEPRPARLPFIKKIQVMAGQSVGLNSSSRTDSRITCSITMDGKVLRQLTTHDPSGPAICQARIP